ncbi:MULTISPECIES: host attachment family protein [unclassified Sphingomonas]|uniref:host attachment family protein n=1 Tax=unclassified Sphingomonas TaxID=196159 RepID=UPI0002F7083A|nr:MULTISPECIES: host attachment protein [unclassified Sphingomonas]
MVDLKKGALVAVVDGEHLKLFKNSGDAGSLKLTEQPTGDVSTENMGSGGRHQSSSANPSDSQQDEDAFAAGVAEVLNKKLMGGSIDELVIIAAPRTLGELRKHYHKTLSAKLVGEVSKDLTGHSVADIEKAVTAA